MLRNQYLLDDENDDAIDSGFGEGSDEGLEDEGLEEEADEDLGDGDGEEEEESGEDNE
jgi:hypothetical protein